MDDEAFAEFLRTVHVNMFTVAKPGCPVYVFHADSEGLNFRTAFKSAGFLLKQCLIWVKNTMVMGRQDYHWKHEPILYGWSPAGPGGHMKYMDRKQTTVLEFDRPTKNTEHPTMKPINLLQYLLGNSSKEGDLVLDLFGGSGSTMVACAMEGRTGYLIEKDPRYADVIVKRMKKLFPGLVILRNGVLFQ